MGPALFRATYRLLLLLWELLLEELLLIYSVKVSSFLDRIEIVILIFIFKLEQNGQMAEIFIEVARPVVVKIQSYSVQLNMK